MLVVTGILGIYHLRMVIHEVVGTQTPRYYTKNPPWKKKAPLLRHFEAQSSMGAGGWLVDVFFLFRFGGPKITRCSAAVRFRGEGPDCSHCSFFSASTASLGFRFKLRIFPSVFFFFFWVAFFMRKNNKKQRGTENQGLKTSFVYDFKVQQDRPSQWWIWNPYTLEN